MIIPNKESLALRFKDILIYISLSFMYFFNSICRGFLLDIVECFSFCELFSLPLTCFTFLRIPNPIKHPVLKFQHNVVFIREFAAKLLSFSKMFDIWRTDVSASHESLYAEQQTSTTCF